MFKYIVGLVVIVALVAGAYWYMNRVPGISVDTAQNQSAKMVFTWNITELGEHAAAPGVPRTGVTVTTGGKTYAVGEFDGSCAEIDGTSWPLVEGEKTGVICWWAGGGSEVGIFEEDGKMVIKVGYLEEGTAETEGFRGGYQAVATIE